MGEAMRDLLDHSPPTPGHAKRDAAARLIKYLEWTAAGRPGHSGSNDPEFWARHDALKCGFADIPTVEAAVARLAELQFAISS